jgi:hypothetical protein
MAKQNTAAPPRRPETARPATTRRPATTQRRQRAEVSRIQWSIPLRKQNLILLVIGIVVIAAAYGLMATAISADPANNQGIWNNANAVTFAPILAVIGYCIIIPLAILYRPKGTAQDENTEATS